MASITSIEINQFRGIKQLTVSDFSNINLIVGDNNSGKSYLMSILWGILGSNSVIVCESSTQLC